MKARSLLAWCVSALAACSAPEPGTDVLPNTRDGSVGSDRPRAVDAGRSTDAGTPRDSSAPTDAGRDSGVAGPIDAGPRIDSGTPRVDAGFPAMDAGAPRDVPAVIDAGGCVYEPVFRDAMGDLRNAAGNIRECWPGEARCFCDRDDDCYAEAGYVPRCAPGSADAGARVDTGTPPRDVGTPPIDTGSPRDVPVVVDTGSPRDTGSTTGGDPVSYTGTFPTASGRRTVTLRVNGNAREVVVYVPSSRGSSPPLILMFHGTNGAGSSMFDETDAQTVANANGAVVVSPSSRYMSRGDWDHRTEETYWETFPNNNPDTNEDLLLTRACIVEARRAYGVDPGRVYALGHSNGAFFATVVASVLADRIAAFATSSGGINPCANTWSCSFEGSGSTCSALRSRAGWCSCGGPDKPVTLRNDGRMPPGYLAHGTNDPLVSVQYTCELEARMQSVGATVQTALRNDGHNLPTDFVSAAWRFMGSRRR